MIVVGIEEDKMAGEIWIHQSKCESSSHGGKEGPPHHLMGEVVRHLHIEHKEFKHGDVDTLNNAKDGQLFSVQY